MAEPLASDDACAFWTRDAVHFPTALSPMGASIMPGLEYGGLAAAGPELCLPFRLDARVFDGYAYSAAFFAADDPTQQQALVEQSHPVMDAAIGALPERWTRDFLPELEQINARLLAVNPLKLDAAGLDRFLGETLTLLARSWTIHFLVVLPIFAAGGTFARLYERATGDQSPSAPYRLLLGEENTTLAIDRALYHLAQAARRAPAVAAALRTGCQRDELASVNGGPAFVDLMQRFLDRYGHRVAAADDLVDPTWIEEPRFVLSALRRLLTDEVPDPDVRRAAMIAERGLLEAQLFAGCPSGLRSDLSRALARARAVWPLRETHAHYIDQMTLSLLRRPLMAAGDLLTRQQLLAEPQAVFMLTLAGLRACLRQGAIDVRAVTAERLRTWEQQKRTQPPPWLGTPPGPDSPAPDPELLKAFGAWDGASPDPATLYGHAASPGTVTGVVRVVLDPDDIDALQPGEILVCRVTTPAWTSLFQVAGGLISDEGGALSHGAIVAREYGLPAVVGTRAATARLRTGQRVAVDGTAGTVTVVQEGA